MLPRQLLRKLPSSFKTRSSLRRFQSSSQPPTPPKSAQTQARATKVLDRVPRFLRKYTDGLRHAPVSHVVSFLILHELTAIVPLVGLATWFHYSKWLPPFFSESAYIATGVEKFGNYFRRKGWFGLGQDDTSGTTRKSKRAMAWNVSESGTRIVVEVATAYAVTKALLPARLLVSVLATPWFARTVMGRMGNGLRGLVGRGKKVGGTSAGGSAAPAAGTGATGKGASAVGKEAPKT